MNSDLDPTDNLTLIDFNQFPIDTEEFESNIQSLGNGSQDTPIFHHMQTRTEAQNEIDDLYNSFKAISESFIPSEPTDTACNVRNDDEQLAMIKSNSESLPVTRSCTEKPSRTTIPLSNCVAVTGSKFGQLQLVFPLEDTYRPRYKSDYFPQNGCARRPRYIADNKSNHYITLRLPSEYEYDFQNEYIRVALITILTPDHHERYYSPYKFQTDHDDIKVPDENPIYIKVDTSRENEWIMRLQLVLIKSKLDQLNYVQPLKAFSNTTTHIRNIINEERLTPKDLINKYKLDQSQLAFTLCTKLPDGTYQPYPDTTVISSVISEASAGKRPNEIVTPPSIDSNANVSCPHCSHCFNPDTASQSTENKKRKTSRASSKTTTDKPNNKKAKNA